VLKGNSTAKIFSSRVVSHRSKVIDIKNARESLEEEVSLKLVITPTFSDEEPNQNPNTIGMR
jgi:hypothetical protein